MYASAGSSIRSNLPQRDLELRNDGVAGQRSGCLSFLLVQVRLLLIVFGGEVLERRAQLRRIAFQGQSGGRAAGRLDGEGDSRNHVADRIAGFAHVDSVQLELSVGPLVTGCEPLSGTAGRVVDK